MMRRTRLGVGLFTVCLAAILAAAGVTAEEAEIEEILLTFVGSTESSAWRGVSLGVDEANVLGRFTHHVYRVAPSSRAGLPKGEPPPVAVLVAGDAATIEELAIRLAPHDVAVLNLTADDDALRRVCRRNLLHIAPSARMKAAAARQWRQQNAGAEVRARAWHSDFLSYAARDLNKRFIRSQGVAMDDGAWAGWAALKMISEAVARAGSAEPSHVLGYLRQEMAFDGQKGVAHTFHQTGQLRQPLLLEEGGRLVGEAPVRGVTDVEDLDSLDLGSCEPSSEDSEGQKHP